MRKIRIGDTVRINKGKDAGKEGKVTHYLPNKNGNTMVVVEGLNVVKKSQKPNAQLGVKGGIVEFGRPINISKVSLIEGGKATRVGFTIDEKTGKKSRVAKKSGKTIN